MSIGSRLCSRRLFCLQRRLQSKFVAKRIETIPPSLHEYLFRSDIPSTCSSAEFSLQLPKLKGSNLEEHFREISKAQVEVYEALLEEAVSITLQPLRPLPEDWIFKEGWTRYNSDGTTSQVDYPVEDVFIFDVEVCMLEGLLPTLAVALSKDAWYSWCSKSLVNGGSPPKSCSIDDLIPLGGVEKPRIAIGHNVGYDRVRVKECYLQGNGSQLRFMDTMSMSIPIYGMADHQHTLYAQDDSEQKTKELWKDDWKNRICKNSLLAIHQHICKGETEPDKGLQQYFVKERLDNVRVEFQKLMKYCASDNLACAQVFHALWPEYKRRFPESATLFGLLTMGNSYLPINQSWTTFYKKNEAECEAMKIEATRGIVRAAKHFVEQCSFDIKGEWMHPARRDPWLFGCDFTAKNKYPYPAWYYKLFKTKSKSHCEEDELSIEDVTTFSQLMPLIFGMVYGPYPLCKVETKGWGYLVPKKRPPSNCEDPQLYNRIISLVEEEKAYGDIPLPNIKPSSYMGFDFYQLPHPSGNGNVGHPVSKHFFDDIEQKVLRPTRCTEEFEKVFNSLKATKFWTNYTERFNSELPVWYEKERDEKGNYRGAIAPAIIPAGTVSRRSVHKLWVTLTNSTNQETIGTGIKSMVQAPPGYKLVGADVDSQEQWLAGLFGDASASIDVKERRAGLTPFSNMMLVGSKNEGTDLHSVVAGQLKIRRDAAKTLNYARLYGSGQAHAVKFLKSQGMKEADASNIARDLFAITKGTLCKWMALRAEVTPLFEEFRRSHEPVHVVTVLGRMYIPSYESRFSETTVRFEQWVLDKIREKTGKKTQEVRVIPKLYHEYESVVNLYYGGYESATFNFLEQSASLDMLRTPVLGCQLGWSLSPLASDAPDREHFAVRYKRSVMNWLVQSSAVDFLHLLLVCMQWLCKEFDIEARFVISIHDEVRYLCKEEEAPRVALALHLCNMYVRAFVSERVGVHELPMSVAFFSQVDCDTVLRKEISATAFDSDGTPIPNGVAWTIEDAIRLTNGSLEKKSLEKQAKENL